MKLLLIALLIISQYVVQYLRHILYFYSLFIIFLEGPMDPVEEETLYDEVNIPESEFSESEAEPFSDDDDINDSTFTDESSNSDVEDNISVGKLNESVIMDGNNSDDEWQDDLAEIPDFGFDDSQSGIQIHFENTPSAVQCFEKLWDTEIMNVILTSMNTYAVNLQNKGRLHRKNSRYSSIKPINMTEFKQFLALCVLQGHLKFPSIRKMFTMDPLYYCPVFHYTMSGRRFEQLLRCFSCAYSQPANPRDKLYKISPLLNRLLINFRHAFYPTEDLSLDESLLLFRGRLTFRQYIKGKRARYGIKFYSLCTTDGYVLNLQIYSGRGEEAEGLSKLETLVTSLMEPYLDRGHHIFMDNFYNSVDLSKKLLIRKTHTTGTLRSNRRKNPSAVTKLKLRKGEHKWQRCGKIYVSKWKDRREVLCITTKYHPKLIPVKNRFGQEKIKPEEVSKYNNSMSGIDRNDQMVSYYSSPRKSIRWYKKVMFHLLDVTLWNAYYIKSKFNNKKTLIQFREELVKEYLSIPNDLNDGRKLVKSGALHGGKRSRIELNDPAEDNGDQQEQSMHFPGTIPNPKSNHKSYHMRCRECAKSGRRKETKYLCKACPNKPPLCIEPCFEKYHKK